MCVFLFIFKELKGISWILFLMVYSVNKIGNNVFFIINLEKMIDYFK